MKIALLISGFTRSLSHNYPALKEILNFNKTHQIDVFIHFTKDEDKIDTYSNQSSIQEIVDLIEPVSYTVEKESDFKLSEDVQLRNTICMWYKIFQVNELKKNQEQITGVVYDIVIRWRPDISLLNKEADWLDLVISQINGKKKSNKIFLPNNFENAYLDKNILSKESLNDQIAIGDSETMNYYSQLFQYIPKYLEQGVKNNSSHLLFFHLNKIANLQICKFDLLYKLTLSLCNVIGIMGDSGSGKSTISKILSPLFSLDSLTLECDRYHKWERHDHNWNTLTHLNPDSNHLDKIKDDLFQLKTGNDIYQVDYNHQTGKFTEAQKIKSQDNIILCGLHTFYHGKMLNLKIFTNPQIELKYYWKLKRDVVERHYKPHDVLKNIKKRMNDYLQYIDPWKRDSDIIINFRFLEQMEIKELDDYLTLLTRSKEPDIILRVYFQKKIDLSGLSKYFQEINYPFQIGYDIDLNHLDFFDNNFQSTQIKDFFQINDWNLEISWDDLQSGYNGIIQLICLYLFDRQEPDKSGTFECAQTNKYIINYDSKEK